MENLPMRDLIWHTCFRWKAVPHQVTGDAKYGTIENIVALEDMGIRAYLALPDYSNRTPFFGLGRFTYDPERDIYRCPQGQVLQRMRIVKATQVVRYRADSKTCQACPVRSQCTTSKMGRQVERSVYTDYVDRVRGYHQTAAYQKAMRKRSVWVEPLFGEAKQWHGMRRFRLRRLQKVNIEALLMASGQNLKRLLSRRGWGRRQWPGGAPGMRLPETFAVSFYLS
jgi:DDE family transposase